MPKEEFPLPFIDKKKSPSHKQGGYFEVFDSSVDEGFVVKETHNKFLFNKAEDFLAESKSNYNLLKQNIGDYLPDAVFTIVQNEDTSEGGYKVRAVQEKADCPLNQITLKTDREMNKSRLAGQLADLAVKCINLYCSSYDEKERSGMAVDIQLVNLFIKYGEVPREDKVTFVDSGGSVVIAYIDLAIMWFSEFIKEVNIENYPGVRESMKRLNNLQIAK